MDDEKPVKPTRVRDADAVAGSGEQSATADAQPADPADAVKDGEHASVADSGIPRAADDEAPVKPTHARDADAVAGSDEQIATADAQPADPADAAKDGEHADVADSGIPRAADDEEPAEPTQWRGADAVASSCEQSATADAQPADSADARKDREHARVAGSGIPRAANNEEPVEPTRLRGADAVAGSYVQGVSVDAGLKHIIYAISVRRFRNPLMLVMLAGLYVILAGFEGINLNGVGAPYLFWHEDGWMRFVAVVALGFFLDEWVYVAFLLDTDPEHPNPSQWYFDDLHDNKLKSRDDLFMSGIGNSVSCSLCLCMVFATAPFWFQRTVALPVPISCFGAFGYMYCGALLGLALRFGIWRYLADKETPFDRYILPFGRHESPDALARNTPRGEELRDYDELKGFHRIGLYKQLAMLSVAAIGCLLHWIPLTKPILSYGIFGSVPVYFCIFLTMVVGVYGFAVFHRRRRWFEGIVLVGCLLVAGLVFASQFVGGLTPAQAIRELRPAPETKLAANEAVEQVLNHVNAGGGAAGEPESDRAVLTTWRGLLREKWADDKPPLVVIANSGGGIKAQVWSTVVLTAIQKELASAPNGQHFANHVRLVTGTSGGMVGASYWVSTVPPLIEGKRFTDKSPQNWLYDQPGGDEQTAVSVPAERMIEQMSEDTLTDVARQMFYNDFLGAPLKWTGLLDARGVALEQAWEENTKAEGSPIYSMRQPLRRLKGGEDAGWRPTLVFAPTVAEDGRRLMISNQSVEYVLVSDLGAGQASVAGYSARLLGMELRLSTAARLSANFPLVINSPAMPIQEGFRIMDAGYIDNYGLVMATQWLTHNRQWIVDNTSGVLFVQISASRLERTNALADDGSGAPELGGFVNASFNKTVHHQDIAIDQLRAWFEEHIKRAAKEAAAATGNTNGNADADKVAADFFRFVSIEYAGPASLSWYLTSAEKLSLLYPFMEDGGNGLFLKKHFSDGFREQVFEGATETLAGWRETGDSKDVDPFEESLTKLPQQLREVEAWWTRRKPATQP